MHEIEIDEIFFYIFYKNISDGPDKPWRAYSGPYNNERTVIRKCKEYLRRFPKSIFKPIRKTIIIETIPLED